MTVNSPCTNVCVLDSGTRWCIGCGRTGDEIAAWSAASDGQRRRILARLPTRVAKLKDLRPCA